MGTVAAGPWIEETAMREWLYILVPMAVAIYFVMYPAKFHSLIQWLMSLLR